MGPQGDSEVSEVSVVPGGLEADHRLETVIATLLRSGVLLATAVVFLGAAVYVLRHGGERPHYAEFHSEPTDLRSVSGILTDLSGLSGRGIIQFGLLVLIATPVLRVAASLLAFALKRDWLYTLLTLIVLILLLYSIFQGLPGLP